MCLKYIRRNPWSLVHLLCLLIFLKQAVSLIKDQIFPKKTAKQSLAVALDDIDFPVLFKLCYKPAFNQAGLLDYGYNDTWSYFLGMSKFNSTVLGWAGHTSNGSISSTVEGDRDKVL